MKNHRILIGITAAIALLLSYTPQLQKLEQGALHIMSRLITVKYATTPVAVVAIDQQSMDEIGPWPWSYQTIARLLDKLSTIPLKSIGLALPLSSSENYAQKMSTQAPIFEHLKPAEQAIANQLLQQMDFDSRLVQALKKNANVVLPVFYKSGTGIAADGRLFANEKLSVHTQALVPSSVSSPWLTKLSWLFFTPSSELNIVSMPASGFSKYAQSVGFLATENRRPWLQTEGFVEKVGDHYYPTFTTQMAKQLFGTPLSLISGYGVNINGTDIQTDAAYGLRARPALAAAGVSNVPIIPAAEVLKATSRSTLFKGLKAVIVGLVASSAELAPNNGIGISGGVTTAPAVRVAHNLNALANNELVQQPYWAIGVQRLAVIVLAIYLMMLPVKLRGWLGFAITALLCLFIINVSVLMVLVLKIFQPLVIPALFVIVGHLLLTTHFKISDAFKSLQLEAANAYRELGLNLQTQGRLDQAFNYMRKCEMDNKLIECLYNLGLEFERRRQFNQAVAVYDYIAKKDSDYRDIQERRTRHQTQSNRDILTASMNPHTATLVVDHPNVAQPVLGRYQIEKIIGQGAMGTVYLGVDPKISRTVAIKTLPLSDEFDSKQVEEVRRRFFREAETAGRLNHPNIVTIFDVGEEHDLAYIAMDYITGEGLDKFAHHDTLLKVDEVFQIGIAVAHALDYAHQQNVVHRDIKPGNIIYDPQSGNVKITDFGIACLTDHNRTRTGTVLGSPSYMSPEQLAGEAVDGRSDIYSLGITLYQLFTGVLPFTADSMASLAYKIANSKPVGVRKIRPELPTCLTRVINKAIEKDPQARYQTGAALAEALSRCSSR